MEHETSEVVDPACGDRLGRRFLGKMPGCLPLAQCHLVFLRSAKANILRQLCLYLLDAVELQEAGLGRKTGVLECRLRDRATDLRQRNQLLG